MGDLINLSGGSVNTGAGESMETRLDAIELHVNYFFNRAERHSGGYPSEPRQRYPELTRVLMAYLKSTADVTMFTPEQYQALCRFLYDDFFVWCQLAGDDALPSSARRALEIIERRDADGLERWKLELMTRMRELDYVYRVGRVAIDRCLKGMQIACDSAAREVACECLDLLFASRYGSGPNNDEPRQTTEAHEELDPEGLEFLGIDDTTTEIACSKLGELRLVNN